MTRIAVRLLLIVLPTLLIVMVGVVAIGQRFPPDVLVFQRYAKRDPDTYMLDIPRHLLVRSPEFQPLGSNASTSPDGHWLAFTDHNYTTLNGDIFLRSPNKQFRLVGHPLDDHSPAWSPEGKRVAFTSNRAGSYNLYLIDVNEDGSPGDIQRLTFEFATDLAPMWLTD